MLHITWLCTLFHAGYVSSSHAFSSLAGSLCTCWIIDGCFGFRWGVCGPGLAAVQVLIAFPNKTRSVHPPRQPWKYKYVWILPWNRAAQTCPNKPRPNKLAHSAAFLASHVGQCVTFSWFLKLSKPKCWGLSSFQESALSGFSQSHWHLYVYFCYAQLTSLLTHRYIY